MEHNVSEQFKKIVQSITYLLSKAEGGLDKILIIKMLWAADRYHLRHYSRLVTSDTYYALPKGPVPTLALDTLSHNGDLIGDESIRYSEDYIAEDARYRFRIKKAPDKNVLSATDIEALDFSYDLMSAYLDDNSGAINFTHKYPEWKRFENILTNIKTSVQMDIFDFFRNPDENVIPCDSFYVDEATLRKNEKSYKGSVEIKQFLYT